MSLYRQSPISITDVDNKINNIPKLLMAKRFYITGRVQGVFFRASTQAKADELEMTGYAHNLADGRVEVLAVGTPAAVEALSRWLWTGPPGAQVENVAAQFVTMDELSEIPNDFSTG